ncbi:MAG: nuclear transport factor 2 family protein [Proteobacteria bacterium]|nr:nuclear transport factor 2 family protein [Pseudomonadota bacterium]
MSEVDRNKALAVTFFDILSRSDIPAMLEAYADDVKLYTMGRTLISGCMNKADAAKSADLVLSAFPKGIRFTLKNITAEGDRVAVEAESEGLHASGRLYANQYHFLMRFRDGKITEFKEYMDTELVTEILCGGARPAAS